MFKFTDDKGRNFFLNIRKEQVKSITNNNVKGCCCITFYDDGGEKWSCVKGTTDEMYAYIFGEKKENTSLHDTWTTDQLKHNIENLDKEIFKLKGDLIKVTKENETLSKQYTTVYDENTELTKQVREFRELSAKHFADSERFNKECVSKGKMLLKFVEERDAWVEEKRELEKRLENQMSNIRSLQNQLGTCTRNIESYQEEVSSLKSNIRTLQDRNKQLEATASRVEDMLTGKCITFISMT